MPVVQPKHQNGAHILLLDRFPLRPVVPILDPQEALAEIAREPIAPVLAADDDEVGLQVAVLLEFPFADQVLGLELGPDALVGPGDHVEVAEGAVVLVWVEGDEAFVLWVDLWREEEGYKVSYIFSDAVV